MTDLAVETAVRFHISLNVGDLNRSVAFYRALFGIEPAKCRPDYAKFEPDEPPLVLSLEPSPARPGGTLNHVGLRLSDAADLVEVQHRLEAAGIHTNREEGVECCYARQTKFWVHDPDQTLWEVYVLEEDIDHRGAGQAASTFTQVPTLPEIPVAEPVVWNHRLMEPLDTVPAGEATLDEVRLQGSFNAPVSEADRSRFLGGLFRALKPGGVVRLHNLVADRPVPGGRPNLPGPASVVSAAPVDSEIVDAFEQAGFVQIALEHFDAAPCFTSGDVQMRQLKLKAAKPAPRSADEVVVLYRGPLKEIVDDFGNRLPRGRRMMVDRAAVASLQAAMPEAVLVFDGAGGGLGCGG